MHPAVLLVRAKCSPSSRAPGLVLAGALGLPVTLSNTGIHPGAEGWASPGLRPRQGDLQTLWAAVSEYLVTHQICSFGLHLALFPLQFLKN